MRLLPSAFKRLDLLLALFLAGCSGLLLRPDAVAPASDLPPGVSITEGRIASDTGCPLDYRAYRPRGAVDNGDWVILAHGFLRSQQRMRDLAATMAAGDMQVATLDFCNQKPWAGRHVQNSRDMVDLARHLGAARVVYAGFSAGGLAAVLAGGADPRAVGVVTLDLVDTQGLGIGTARGLTKPLLAIAGEPTNCNALANGSAVYRVARDARVKRVGGAGHCDFESPTDGLCELVCADPDGTAETHRDAIIASATAAARSLLDEDVSGWPRRAPSAPTDWSPPAGAAHLRQR